MPAFGKTAAIVGLGQLGTLLANKIDAERLLLVSRDRVKAEAMASRLPNAEAAVPDQISEAGLVVFCLHAHQIIDYFRDHAAWFHPEAILVNPATMLQTSDVRENFASRRWVPLKFLGSVKSLATGATALMVTDDAVALDRLAPFVSPLGQLIVGQERWVSECNTIATRHALTAALRIEDDIRAAGFPESLIYPAQTVVAKGIIQSYADQTLGHFAKEILNRIQADRSSSRQP